MITYEYLRDVYFYNDAWEEYVFCREDSRGYWIGPSGRGSTLEKARQNYEAQLIERLGKYERVA